MKKGAHDRARKIGIVFKVGGWKGNKPIILEPPDRRLGDGRASSPDLDRRGAQGGGGGGVVASRSCSGGGGGGGRPAAGGRKASVNGGARNRREPRWWLPPGVERGARIVRVVRARVAKTLASLLVAQGTEGRRGRERKSVDRVVDSFEEAQKSVVLRSSGVLRFFLSFSSFFFSLPLPTRNALNGI